MNKLAKQPFGSAEGAVIRNYLDVCLEMPWNTTTKERVSVDAARRVLEKDHFGLEKGEGADSGDHRRPADESGRQGADPLPGGPARRGQDLHCHQRGQGAEPEAGPPEPGRRSGRGGHPGTSEDLHRLHARPDHRGHQPQRVYESPCCCWTRSTSWATTTGATRPPALLEVLDSEQNSTFRDHFLEIPVDLSKIMFITTANTTDTIPRPLLDRMEVIQLSSYTDEEKLQIAKRHLFPKQLAEHGLKKSAVRISDDVYRAVIRDYTRESGVRLLERRLAAICRKADMLRLLEGHCQADYRDRGGAPQVPGLPALSPDLHTDREEIGVVNGLAWTEAGGEILEVEVNVMDGSGKLELTGNLGDVMKESAQGGSQLPAEPGGGAGDSSGLLQTKDIHVHFPEGAVPKDGPSAGIAVTTAMLRPLTDRKIKAGIAMTGEVTLRGRVLPIGGLKGEDHGRPPQRHHHGADSQGQRPGSGGDRPDRPGCPAVRAGGNGGPGVRRRSVPRAGSHPGRGGGPCGGLCPGGA